MIQEYMTYFLSLPGQLVTFLSQAIPGTGITLAGFLIGVVCLSIAIQALLLRPNIYSGGGGRRRSEKSDKKGGVN